KICVAFGELRISYEYIPVDLDKNEQKTREFLALNPHGKIPVLVDGDFVLPESNAILWYLAETHPDSNLVPWNDANPRTRQDRARIAQFIDFAQTTLYGAYADWWNHALGDEKKR